jgi:chemotaxis protein CheX
MSTVAENPRTDSAATARLVTHFMTSIRDVLKTMAHMDVKIGTPALKKNPLPSYDVSGIIGFSGNFVGSMVLSFQQSTAAAIVAAFAGMPVPSDSPDFADAVGELANMIAGSAKTSFGGGANISVPSIIMGHGHTIARLQDIPCLVIPCQTAAGEFAVEVNIKSQTQVPARPT